jgi:hypothetical protein
MCHRTSSSAHATPIQPVEVQFKTHDIKTQEYFIGDRVGRVDPSGYRFGGATSKRWQYYVGCAD